MSLDSFKDKYGFIGHKDSALYLNDFGDSCQRTFSESICTNPDLVDVLKFMMLYEFENERFVRHWDKTMWTGKSGLSRDQFKPMMWACALKHNMFPSTVIKNNWYFTWNDYPIWPTNESKQKTPDFVLPTIVWGSDIRAQRATKIGHYTLLNLCDLVDLIGTLVLVVKSWFKPNETSSDLNQINEIIFKHRTVKTPVSVLTRYVYKYLRSAPMTQQRGDNKFISVLKVYYWDPKRMPPMYDVYQSWIDRLL